MNIWGILLDEISNDEGHFAGVVPLVGFFARVYFHGRHCKELDGEGGFGVIPEELEYGFEGDLVVKV